MMYQDYDDPESDLESEDEEEDYYSPTDWDREPDERDEDYAERIQDLEDFLDYYN